MRTEVLRGLLLFIAAVSGAPGAAFAAELTLSPQSVVDRVVRDSREADQIRQQYERSEVPILQARGVFDWGLSASGEYSISRARLLSGLNNEEDRTFTADLALVRKVPTGTTFTLGYNRVDQDSDLNPFLANLRPAHQVYDNLSLRVRQELVGNFFGITDRYSVRIAEKRRDQAALVRAESLETLALQALQVYWAAYTSKETLREQLEARKTYADLVQVLEKRSQVGYTEKADLLKARAELLNRDATVKSASESYLGTLDSLFRLMQMPPADDVEFEIADSLPPVPSEASFEAESSREVRALTSEITNAELEMKAADLASLPAVDLLASAQLTGRDEFGGQSFSEVLSARYPAYAVGVEFRWAFDSDVLAAARTDRRIRHDEAITQRHLALERQNVALRDAARRVRALHSVARSAIDAVELREKALREQEKNFRQGRLGLSQLIIDYNDLFRARSTRALAIGNYHLALNELAAVQDRLVRADPPAGGN